MKTNAELSSIVTQAVNVLERHMASKSFDDHEAIGQMDRIFQGQACRKAAAKAGPSELSKLVRRAMNVLKKNEAPQICSDHEAMSVLHSIFDGQRCRKALRVKTQRSELFRAFRDCSKTAKLPEANVEARIRELRMAIFLRRPTRQLRCDSEANFRTLLKAIRACPESGKAAGLDEDLPLPA